MGLLVTCWEGGWNLNFIQPPIPSDRLSTGEENRHARSLATTHGQWEPLALAPDFSGDETMPKPLTPRYCRPHILGTISLLSSPVLSGKPSLQWVWECGANSGTRWVTAVTPGVGEPLERNPDRGRRHSLRSRRLWRMGRTHVGRKISKCVA